MKNTSLSLAAGLAIFTANCSSASQQEVGQEVRCNTRIAQFKRILDDTRRMLIGASMYIDMARIGTPGALKDAQELRPKIKVKLGEIKTQQEELRQLCPDQYQESSGVQNISRFELEITSIKNNVKQLGGYIDSE